MTRAAYIFHHRTARLGNLGPLAFMLRPILYNWFLREVYDLRFPHVGDNRHAMNGARFDSLRKGGKHAGALFEAYHRTKARRAACYDVIYLADGEWGNDSMTRIAAEWFAQHPACNFVEVHEHGGWFLGFRRDLSCWSTANDGASCRGIRPALFSGVCHRRTVADGKKEVAA